MSAGMIAADTDAQFPFNVPRYKFRELYRKVPKMS